MALGDHIYVKGFPHDHHGIDCGDGTVIHYEGKEGRGKITLVSKVKFSNGKKISIKNYDKKFSPFQIIKRAKRRLGEKEYNAFFNNCEHFAYECTTGEADSYQIINASIGGLGVAATGVGLATATTTVAAPGLLGLVGFTTTVAAFPVAAVIGGALLTGSVVYGALKTIDNWDD